jgi:hypothetical protein
MLEGCTGLHLYLKENFMANKLYITAIEAENDKITLVRRGDIDLLPKPDMQIEYGDQLGVGTILKIIVVQVMLAMSSGSVPLP